MCKKVDAAPARLVLQLAIENISARGYRSRARDGSHYYLCADCIAQNVEDVGPVVHAHAGELEGAARVEAIETVAQDDRVARTAERLVEGRVLY